ncbi:MAG: hypothetical protein EZS28_040974, partial [Streblomastix strix]
AESGTVWMYDQNWYNSGDIVPDQVTPASDANPLIDSGTGVVGTSTEYSRGDHYHPLNVTTTVPPSDSASGSVGTTNYYARNDHSHPLNITTTIPPQDSASGSVGTTNYYARNDHSHPINVETNASNIPIVNGVGANGSSAFYARQDHVHPQQLTYDGNVTATKFIKTGGLATELLCANGDTTAIVVIDSNSVKKTGKSLQEVQGYLRYKDYSYNDEEAQEESDDNDYQTRGQIYSQYVNKSQTETITGTPTSYASATCGNVQINPVAAAGFDDGLRIARTIENTGSSSIELGCSRTSNSGAIQGQWVIYTPSTSADKLQSPVQVDHQVDQLIILQAIQYYGGANSTDPIGGFYSNGTNICWRAKSVTLGSVPP